METKNLDNIYIILVQPKNAGNIGSTVRAMKNMGITNLRLVKPVEYKDIPQQKKMGYRSQDIIQKCQEFSSLNEALADISFTFLATTRKGKWKKDFLSPWQAAETIVPQIKKGKIAIIFGREDSGVTIDESQLANYYIIIPAAIRYPSLNLSQAVMVIVYEIYKSLSTAEIADPLPRMAKRAEFERLHENLWNLMKSLEIREEEKGLFYRSLKRALNRTHWTNADIAVFDRICKQVRWFNEREKIPGA